MPRREKGDERGSAQKEEKRRDLEVTEKAAGLKGLSETHLVSEDSVDAAVKEIDQPVQPLYLVGAHLSVLDNWRREVRLEEGRRGKRMMKEVDVGGHGFSKKQNISAILGRGKENKYEEEKKERRGRGERALFF